MTITEKYLEALRLCDGWVTTGEWALKVAESYPDLLEKAEREAAAQQNDTTGLREITARIASNIARGAYQGQLEIDSSERPRKIRYITPEEVEEHEKAEIEEELETLTRAERIKKDLDTLTEYEKYRISEMETIAKTFNQYCKTDLEVDHAEAIMSDAWEC